MLAAWMRTSSPASPTPGGASSSTTATPSAAPRTALIARTGPAGGNAILAKAQWIDIHKNAILPAGERRRNGMGLRDRSGVPGAARLGRRVRPGGGRAARPAVAAACSSPSRTTTLRKVLDPLKEQVRSHELWATHLGPELGGKGYGPAEAFAAERDPRPLVRGRRSSSGARRRTPATPRSSPTTARPSRRSATSTAAERRDLLLLLDDRAARRLRPDDVRDPGRARRRRMGHQRLEVLLVERADGVVPHRHGRDQPRGQRRTRGCRCSWCRPTPLG